jgi:hypothetical protein
MHYHLKCAREEKWYQNWKARQRRYSFYASIIQPGQMAEGLLRAIHGDVYEVHSAGIKGSQVDPRAIRVMNEIGIDISHQRSKSLDEYRGITFDLAVIVCDKAKEKCPLCGINMRGIGKALPAKEVSTGLLKIRQLQKVPMRNNSTRLGG